MQNHNKHNKQVKLMKPNTDLEEFLFHNPDVAIYFHNLSSTRKNQWIKSWRDAKTEQARIHLKKALKKNQSQATLDSTE